MKRKKKKKKSWSCFHESHFKTWLFLKDTFQQPLMNLHQLLQTLVQTWEVSSLLPGPMWMVVINILGKGIQLQHLDILFRCPLLEMWFSGYSRGWGHLRCPGAPTWAAGVGPGGHRSATALSAPRLTHRSWESWIQPLVQRLWWDLKCLTHMWL